MSSAARARSLPGLEPDGKLIWTYREAMVPPAMPKSLLVVGSGAIGMEFASFYSDLGADVTVVEVLDRVLPVEDADISDFVQKAFKKQGVKILTGAKVEALTPKGNGVAGKIKSLEAVLGDQQFDCNHGIAHTRWATHGEPNTRNAHPHLGMTGDVVVVHNGIVENFKNMIGS